MRYVQVFALYEAGYNHVLEFDQNGMVYLDGKNLYGEDYYEGSRFSFSVERADDKKAVLSFRVEVVKKEMAVYSCHSSVRLANMGLKPEWKIQYADPDSSGGERGHASQAALMSGVFLDSMMAGGEEDQAPVVRLLDSLLIKGYNTNVSDIHIEPCERETVVRMRTDGMLLPYMTLSSVLHQGLVARTKILAQMDIAEKRKPQDGHFKVSLDGTEINIRVSFVPHDLWGEGRPSLSHHQHTH